MLKYDPQFIDDKFRYSGALGVSIEGGKTIFSLWAPLADAVALCIYNSAIDPSPAVYPLCREENVWRLDMPCDLCGKYYTYRYTYGGETTEGVDPYAVATSANGGKGYIVDISKLDPKGWERSDYVKLENYTDAILYEAHVRDLSSDQASGIRSELRGKFKALTEKVSRSPAGRPTCLDYIKDLGITHVHLLPVFDYGRIDEIDPKEDYNWGYDPENYNVPEGSYSLDPLDPESRIRELKELVLSLHEAGIGVVMDVVYNHTYKLEGSNLYKAFPGYYYRYSGGKPSNGSGCGNEIASERAMVRKYIIDSVLFWAKEYKIDGFRFDLMAVLDTATLNELSLRLKEINPNVILYGEGWTGGASALEYERSASKYNSCKTPAYAYFNDNYRDAIKGETFSDTALGYISGNYHLRKTVEIGLLGLEDWAENPDQIINYCEAHDNLTLWDKLMVSVSGCNERDRKKMARLAMALVLLAQGVPFIHAGQEFLRSKALGNGRFDHNSYSSPDSVNSLKWTMADKNSSEVDYFKGLISLRKSHPLLRFTSRDDVLAHSEVLPSSDGTIELKLFDQNEELLILVNPIPRAKMFFLPDGEWEMIVSDTAVSESPLGIYCEGIFLPPISVMVLKKFRG